MAIAQQYEEGLLHEVTMHRVESATVTNYSDLERCVIEFSDGKQTALAYVNYKLAKVVRDQLLKIFPVKPAATLDPVLFMLQLSPEARGNLKAAIADIEVREAKADATPA